MNPFVFGLIATASVGLLTYGARALFIVTIADRELPPVLLTALRFVGPAILASLVVSLAFAPDTEAGWAELAALGVGAAVGSKTRSLAWVLVGGMVTLWVLTWIGV